MYDQISSLISISKAIVVSLLRTWVGLKTVQRNRGIKTMCRLCDMWYDMQRDYEMTWTWSPVVVVSPPTCYILENETGFILNLMHLGSHLFFSIHTLFLYCMWLNMCSAAWFSWSCPNTLQAHSIENLISVTVNGYQLSSAQYNGMRSLSESFINA